MSYLHGNIIDTELVIANRETRRLVSKTKYGEIDSLKTMPLVMIKTMLGELIDSSEIDNINFSGKIPRNKRRAKSIFELEEMIINEYGSYIPIRLDLKSINKEIHISVENFKDFFCYCRNNLRHNKVRDTLAGWFYVIEEDSIGNNHAHWHMLLRGDRYIDLTKKDREILYRNDYNDILNTVYNYLGNRNDNLSYCNINMFDLSNRDDKYKVLLITKDNYLLRNCYRGYSSYTCKTIGNGRRYDKSFFEKNVEMEKDTLYSWIQVKDRIIDNTDMSIYLYYYPTLIGQEKRINNLFDMENEISSYYDNYSMVSLKVTGDIKHSDIQSFLRNYQVKKINTKMYRNVDIAYCWSVNDIEGKVEFTIYAFLDLDCNDNDQNLTLQNIGNLLKKWIGQTSDRLSSSTIDIDYYGVSSDSVTDRNNIRYLLLLISLVNNETIYSYDDRNIRIYGKSQVRPPNRDKK